MLLHLHLLQTQQQLLHLLHHLVKVFQQHHLFLERDLQVEYYQIQHLKVANHLHHLIHHHVHFVKHYLHHLHHQ